MNATISFPKSLVKQHWIPTLLFQDDEIRITTVTFGCLWPHFKQFVHLRNIEILGLLIKQNYHMNLTEKGGLKFNALSLPIWTVKTHSKIL